MQCFRASFHHSRQAVFNTEKANIWLFVFVKTFYGFVSCAVWLVLYAEADRVLSRPACLSVRWPQNCFYKCRNHCSIALQPNRLTRLFSYSVEVKQREEALCFPLNMSYWASNRKKRRRVHVSGPPDFNRLTFLQQPYFSSVEVTFIRIEQTFP